MRREWMPFATLTFLIPLVFSAVATGAPSGQLEYRVLATKKTSTMEKELNELARSGFRLRDAMGGQTAFGGKETVVVMVRSADEPAERQFEYRLLATSKTSTMQQELQTAADLGFDYAGQTVFETSFGGKEVVVILERDLQKPVISHEYRLLATSKTSTMEKELGQMGQDGFVLVGLTVGKTKFGGRELVSILKRPVVAAAIGAQE